jgi:hypothetical protein
VVRGEAADKGRRQKAIREWRYEPFLDLGLEAAVHVDDVIFQPSMF